MDLAIDVVLGGRSNVYRLLSTPDDGVDASVTKASVNDRLLTHERALHTSHSSGLKSRTGLAPSQQWFVSTCCAAAGFGVSTAWYAVLGGVVFLGTLCPGDTRAVVTKIVTCLYVSMAVAMVVLQFVPDCTRCKSVVTFAVRLAVAFAVMAACCAAVPFLSSWGALLGILCGMGVAQSLLFTTASSLMEAFPARYTGVFVSGCAIACVAVVGLCFWSGVTSSSSLAAVRVTYFATAAAVVCGAIASFLLLLSRIGRYFVSRPRLEMEFSAAGGFDTTATFSKVISRVWASQLASMLLLVPSATVVGTLGFIPSKQETWENPQLGVLLVFLFTLSNLIGRQMRCSTEGRAFVFRPGVLLSLAICRLLLLATPVVLYVCLPLLPVPGFMAPDAAVVAILVALGCTGGMLQPHVYESCLKQVHPALRQKLASLHVVWSSVCIVMGLMLAVGVSHLVVSNTVVDMVAS